MEVACSLFHKIAVMDKGRVVEAADSYTIFADPKHEVTKRLVHKAIDLDIPDEAWQHEPELYALTYIGESAYEPVIANVARKFKVDVPILAGKIEYIQSKPFGVLVIGVKGADPDRAAALAYLREHASVSIIRREA